jgi:hypothetical protein
MAILTKVTFECDSEECLVTTNGLAKFGEEWDHASIYFEVPDGWQISIYQPANGTWTDYRYPEILLKFKDAYRLKCDKCRRNELAEEVLEA